MSISILSQLILTVTSSLRILYLTGCMNFYPKDGQNWLHFGFKTLHNTISSNDLNPKILIITHF